VIGSSLLPVCILAGGRGTRLGEAVRDLPKPLLTVAGEPFLRHQLGLLRSHGASRIVLSVGYRGELVQARIGDGADLGLEISYVFDGPELRGTAGALRNALPLLGDAFFVLYGDTYLRIDYANVQQTFQKAGFPALMTVLRNEGRWDTSNVLLEGDRVLVHDKENPTEEMQWIDYGLGVLRAEALDAAGSDEADLARVYAALAAQGQLGAYLATERFYEIGTPEGLAETAAFLKSLS
jgi:N-acetyl-alpha-D-muramate 1-phosphate uridylyltransferase